MRGKTTNRNAVREIIEQELLKRIEGRWVKVAGSDGVYLFHRRNAHGRGIEQLVISGNPLIDGVYALKKYRLDEVYDQRLRRNVIRITVVSCDQVMGLSEIQGYPLTEQLQLLAKRFGLSCDDLSAYMQGNNPTEAEEVLLDA